MIVLTKRLLTNMTKYDYLKKKKKKTVKKYDEKSNKKEYRVKNK